MVCEKCGKEIYSGDLFCENCGNKINETTEVAEKQEAAAPNKTNQFIEKLKNNKSTQRMCAIIAGVVVALIIGICILVGISNTIKLTNYVSISEVSGINGYATVEYEFDWEALYTDVFGEAPDDVDSFEGVAKALQYEEKCSELRNCITINVENNNSLSNGDTVKIAIDFNSDDASFGKTIKGGNYTEKIEGLEDGTVIDVFDEKYVSIKTDGVNGFGKCTIEKGYDETWQYGITYTADKAEGLSNGDKIIITATFDEGSYEGYITELAKQGLALTKTATKEITVSGLAVYASSDNISDTLISEATNKVLAEYKEADDCERKDLKVVGVFFKDKIDKSEPYTDFWNGFKMYNSLDVVISYVDTYGSTRIERTVHVVFENIEDGLSNLDDIEMEDDGFETRILTADEAEKEFLDEFADEFKVTKLQ